MNKQAVPTLEDVSFFTSLVKEHGWNNHTKPILSIFETISLRTPTYLTSTYLSGIANVVNLLHLIASVENEGNLDSVFEKVLDDCVAQMVKGQGQRIRQNNDIVDLMFKRGKPCHFQSLKEWVQAASLDTLSQLRSCLAKTNLSVSTETKEEFKTLVNNRWKLLQIAKLQERKCGLKQAVRGGQPVFSWSMLNAKTSNSALDAFLRSDRPGPTEIITGGGISNARRLESYGRGSYNSQPILLQQGFSAKIVAQGVSQRAGVVVTKTRDYYNATVAKYDQDVKALKEVKEELCKLGVESGEPDAKHARTDVDVIVID